MTSGLDAIGDAATGAVLAEAVEPGHGRNDGPAHGACLNCGTALAGAYCHACGQNGHLHRTLMGFGHDLVHGVFHFEGKFWNTLPMLFFKPGELTRRYIHGERAKFVSPVAMFLFCVFLMFAVVGGLAGRMHLPSQSDLAGSGVTAQVAGREALDQQAASTSQSVAALEGRIADERAAGNDTAKLEKALSGLKAQAAALENAKRYVPGGAIDLSDLHTGWPFLDHGIEQINENPNLFLYQLKTSAYKYSWLLIPISTPMLWLLFFWKRQYRMYDHLIFVTFSLIFVSLLVTIGTVAGALGVGTTWIVTIIATVIPFHVHSQLRGAYPGSRAGAVIRTILLLGFAFAALVLYGAILAAMGVMH